MRNWSRLPHEPLPEAGPRLVEPRPRLELAGKPEPVVPLEPVTYSVRYVLDAQHPAATGWYVLESSGAVHGPIRDERTADQFRDYLEEFPRRDPRD